MNETKYEAIVREFGNGAHITVPKEWTEDIVVVERVCPFCPPGFENVEEGAEVFVDITTGETISGEVIEFSLTVEDGDDKMFCKTVIDTGHNFYRIRFKRYAGDEGWPDEYDIERSLASDEIQETDEIITLNESGMWKNVGAIESIAVKQSVSQTV